MGIGEAAVIETRKTQRRAQGPKVLIVSPLVGAVDRLTA
jgi:hypothetical protein